MFLKSLNFCSYHSNRYSHFAFKVWRYWSAHVAFCWEIAVTQKYRHYIVFSLNSYISLLKLMLSVTAVWLARLVQWVLQIYSICLYSHVEVKWKVAYVNLYFIPRNKKYHFFKLVYNHLYYYCCLIRSVL